MHPAWEPDPTVDEPSSRPGRTGRGEANGRGDVAGDRREEDDQREADEREPEPVVRRTPIAARDRPTASGTTAVTGGTGSGTTGDRARDRPASEESGYDDDAPTDLLPGHRPDEEDGLFDLGDDRDDPREQDDRAARRRGAERDRGRRERGEAGGGAGARVPRGEEGFGAGRRRRRWGLVLALGVLVIALVGGLAITRDLWGNILFPPDFEGPGAGAVVVQVGDGDSIRAVGDELVSRGVVASARTFGSVSEDDPRGRGVAPGFYVLRRQMSAQEALDALLQPGSRLGRVEVRGGTQLDDTAGADGAVVPGVLSLVARATCAPDAGGNPVCRTPDEIRQVMTATDPAALGVPAWAAADVGRAEPGRRLEGLIAPGTYDVPPGASARDALGAVVRASAERLATTGIADRAASSGLSPYQVLVIASIAEKEGVEQDFPKIARVIENRLPIPMRLQMDSTINFPLDRQTLLTTPFDRAAPGPYNTYLNLGLPPTPIAAASTEAVGAALAPAEGRWIYFVKCQTDGVSCFAVTPEEHDANRRLAQERGVY